MKTKIYLLLTILSFGSNFLLAQHENDNWLFGNNKWNFNASSFTGFTLTTNLSPTIRYISSVISDKNTGELLFYSDGYKIYNKNGAVMTNGDNLFGTNNTAFNTFGNPSDQSSIIVPLPSSNSIYYVFYINGNKKVDDQGNSSDTTSYNYGLRYAIVDMTLSGGLGAVTSKNNLLFSNSTTNALTSTVGINSYWIVTANNGNFLSYKLTANGLNTTPVASPASNFGTFFKISPDSKKILTRINSSTNPGVFLADFNNITGAISNQTNIFTTWNYRDLSDFTNSAEFSPNSKVIYFISSDVCICDTPTGSAYLRTYNIPTGTFSGHPISGPTGSLQRATNGKIYMVQASVGAYNSGGVREVNLGWTNPNGSYQSYNWKVYDTPNDPNPGYATEYGAPVNARNAYSFPQLVPHLDYVNTCPDNLDINYQITASENFQAGQHIIASSGINNGLIVNYKAGTDVTLLPGFNVKATETSLFKAYIGPCNGVIQNFAKNNSPSENYSKEIKTSLTSDVKIYPNPASKNININSENEKLISWEMYDMSGQSILRGNTTPIDVQSIIKGSYLLKINFEKRQVSKRVIVK